MSSSSVYNHRPMQPNSIPPTRSATVSLSTPSMEPHTHSAPSLVPSQGPPSRPVAIERGAERVAGMGAVFSLVDSLDVVRQEFEVLRAELLRAKAQKEETEKQLEAQVLELNFITKALFDLEVEHGRIRQSYEDEIVRLRNEIRKAQQASGHAPPSQASSHTGPPVSQQTAPQRPPSVANGSRRVGGGGSVEGVLSPRVGGSGGVPGSSIIHHGLGRPVSRAEMVDHVKMRESPVMEREREKDVRMSDRDRERERGVALDRIERERERFERERYEREGKPDGRDREREEGRIDDGRNPKRIKSAHPGQGSGPQTPAHTTRDLYHTGTPQQTPALPPHPGLSNPPSASKSLPPSGPLGQYRFPGPGAPASSTSSPRVPHHPPHTHTPHPQPLGTSPHPHNVGVTPYPGPGGGPHTPSSALTPVPTFPSQANGWSGFQNLTVDELSITTLPPEWRVEGTNLGVGYGAHGINGAEERKPGASLEWVALYNPRSKRTLRPELLWTFGHDTVVCCAQFSSDGRFLATGCNRSAQIYDVRTGQKICTVVDKTAPSEGDLYIRSVRFSPDGALLATGAEDRKIRIWDIGANRVIHTFDGHAQEIYSLDFSRDGRYIVSGSGDRTMRIWNMQDKSVRVIHVIPEEGNSPANANGTTNGNSQTPQAQADSGLTSVSISPDGTLVAAGSLDTLVRVYSIQTGQLLAKLRGHQDSVYSVSFVPDGRGVVSGSLDRGVKVWDVSAVVERARMERDRELAERPIEIDRCVKNFIGHKDFVLSVAVSNDSRWVVSGSKDRCVHFWDNSLPSRSNQDAALQFVLQGHKNSVISLDINPNGGMLATGSGDNTARVWRYTAIA